MCVTQRDNDDDDNDDVEDDEEDDDMTTMTLNRSYFSSNKLPLHDNRWLALDTHRHTHTHGQRGETIGRAVRGLLYACVLGVQRESKR